MHGDSLTNHVPLDEEEEGKLVAHVSEMNCSIVQLWGNKSSLCWLVLKSFKFKFLLV